MTVRELIKMLEILDQDSLVIISADAEGNDYSPMDDYSTGLYWANTTWSGDFHSDREELEEDEEEPSGVKCVCLWPVN